MPETQGRSTLSFAEAVEAARSEIAQANAATDAALEGVAPDEPVTVVDQAEADVLEHAPKFADEATKTAEPFMFEDVADDLIKPNPFEGVGEDKDIREQFVTVDGFEQPIQVAELVNGYLRQADYTRKTQALAEERKQFEAESAAANKLMDALKQDPAGTIASLAVNVGLIQESDLTVDLVTRINRDHRVPSREEMESQLDERARAMLESDPRIQEAEDLRIQRQVEASFKEIEDTHSVTLSGRDKEAILQQAVEMQTMRLDLAFLALKSKADKIRAERQAAAQAAPQAPTAGKVADSTATQPDTPPSSIREAWARASAATSS